MIKNKYKTLCKGISQGLFEYSIEKNKKIQVYDDIVFLNKIITKKYCNIFRNPAITKDEKKQNINEIFKKIKKIEKITKNFLYLIIDRNYFFLVKDICEYYFIHWNFFTNIKTGKFFSATKYSKKHILQIETKLSKIHKQKIKLIEKIDKSIKSGFIIYVNKKIYNYSTNFRINELKKIISQKILIEKEKL